MTKKRFDVNDHVGELLSGLIDGELTQQQRQRVELHCEACASCRQELARLRELRRQTGAARLSDVSEDTWRESMKDKTVRSTRGIGWLLLLAGVVALGGVVVYEFVTDPGIATYMKVIIGAIYGGLALLFVSVLRQRLIERRTDKYKDVEI